MQDTFSRRRSRAPRRISYVSRDPQTRWVALYLARIIQPPRILFHPRVYYAFYLCALRDRHDAKRCNAARHAARFLCKTESFSRSASHDSLDRVIFAKITSAAFFPSLPTLPAAVRFSPRCKLQSRRTRVEYINWRTFYAMFGKVKYTTLKYVCSVLKYRSFN